MWRRLSDTLVSVHYGFLAYVALGGFLAWRWPRTILAHLPAVGWGAVIVTTKAPCPLTAVQNATRAQQGLPPLEGGFIDNYVRGRFYPSDRERTAQLVVAGVVFTSYVGLVRRAAVSRGRG